MTAPVTMALEDGSKWENKINAYREWEWDGPEPLNLRIMRFVGIA